MGLRLLLLAFLLALQSIPGSAAAAARDGQHDFDFQFGTWSVHVERLLHPLSGSTTWVQYDGTHVVDEVWRGRANLGVLEIDGPAGNIEGQSLRLYNPQTRQWSFTFARSGDGSMGSPMIGKFEGARGEFFNQETYDGRAVLVRNITSDITATTYRDEYAYSADGGRKWETNWIATFTLANGRTPTAPALGDGILATPPTVGAFAGGRGDFYDRETLANGRAIYVRFAFSRVSQNRFHFEQSFSDDGAVTWEANWVADFMKA